MSRLAASVPGQRPLPLRQAHASQGAGTRPTRCGMSPCRGRPQHGQTGVRSAQGCCRLAATRQWRPPFLQASRGHGSCDMSRLHLRAMQALFNLLDLEANMGTMVYGPGIEPGGMQLENQRCEVPCPACPHQHAQLHLWESADAGSIEQHEHLWCPACGYTLPAQQDADWET